MSQKEIPSSYKWVAKDLFGPLRSSLPEEQEAYKKMKEKYSTPLGFNIWDTGDQSMGEIEVGGCNICGQIDTLTRTYYYYGIKCDCHSPEHFEVVWTCPECQPVPPKKTTIEIKPLIYGQDGKYQPYHEEKK